jgi:hypothetical protein
MEFVVYAPLEFKLTGTVGLSGIANDDPDYSDVFWRTPRAVNCLDRLLLAPGAICDYPYRSKAAILALRLAEIWRNSA